MARARKYKEAADLFQILAHPARLRILDELRRGQACVCHLQTVLGRPQAYVSQQLRVLREAEIVVGERDGLNVYYRIAHAQVAELLERILGPGIEPTRLPGCPCPYCQAAAAGLPAPESLPATQIGLV
jgi:ArsR family transcriptional regulator